MHKYKTTLYCRHKGHAFFRRTPELPGNMAAGYHQEAVLRSVGDAMELVADAMKLSVERAQEFGRPVPQRKHELLILTMTASDDNRAEDGLRQS